MPFGIKGHDSIAFYVMHELLQELVVVFDRLPGKYFTYGLVDGLVADLLDVSAVWRVGSGPQASKLAP